MDLEVIEITLSEFTKITGQVAELKDMLHQLEPLAQAQRTLLDLSPDPAREILKLRDQLEEKSAKIVQLQAELQGKPRLEEEQRSGKLRKDQLISAVLEKKPELTSEERSFLHLVLPVFDKLWASSSYMPDDRLPAAESQINSLKDALLKSNKEVNSLKMKTEGLEGNVEALQSSLEFIMTEAETLRKKVKQYEETQDELANEMRKKDEELEYYRVVAKEKYALELRNGELELQVGRLERTCDSLKAGMEELTIKACEGINNDKLRTEVERLSKALREAQGEVQRLESELQQAHQSSNTLSAKLRDSIQPSSQQIAALQTQLTHAQAEARELSDLLEDAHTETTVLQTKHLQEAKSLKSEIAKEKSARLELQQSLENCRLELHRTQEVKMIHARVVAASANEKKMVEALRGRVDELEARNRFLLVTMQQVDDVKQELIREKQRSTQLSEELRRLRPCA